MNRTALLIAAILFPALVERAVGQVEPKTALRLHPGQTVRIRLHDGHGFEARLVAVDTAPAQLRFATPQPPVPVADVESIWLKNHAARTGAIIGGSVAGAGMLLVAGSFCVSLGEGEGCSAWGTVAALSMGAAAGGALIGVGIGSLVTRWHVLDATNITVSLGPGVTGPTFAAGVRF
ncbi:MAG TPA: hypothetical protein VKD28_17330 [Gemmatimonadales bacterium]|nr:hypothetical protein [Gemmatimonadales bacterium]